MSSRAFNMKIAIEAMYRCSAWHVATDNAREVASGVMDTFNLVGYPPAKRCYVWSLVEDDQMEYVTVLEISPVDSVESAARVAIKASGRGYLVDTPPREPLRARRTGTSPRLARRRGPR
jgi:hypothetical protein